jgi:hypothetical protein
MDRLRPLVLEQCEDIRLIYLFGSQAHGLVSSQSELAIALKSDVDLIDLLSASTVTQNQVIHHGMCIYDAKNYATSFDMQVMSMYQHLNDERAGILQQHMSMENE